MIEMEVDVCGSVLPFGAHAVGIAAEDESGEQSRALLAFPDLLRRRPLLRKFRHVAPIGERDVEIELVETRIDQHGAAAPEILPDGVDELDDPEGGARCDFGPGAPERRLPGEE